MLQPFAGYREFAQRQLDPRDDEKPVYGFLRRFDIGSYKVGFACINSALFSGRARDSRGEVSDQGSLVVSEHQVKTALDTADDLDYCLAVSAARSGGSLSLRGRLYLAA